MDYESKTYHSLALNQQSRTKEEVMRLLWDVCKGFGTTGECIFIVMKHRIGEVL